MQYQRSMYSSQLDSWKNIQPRNDYTDWDNKELNDIYYPEKDTSFMYTGYQRSGQGRSQQRLRERFGSQEKFIDETRKVLNSCTYNVGLSSQSKKIISIAVEPVSDDVKDDKARSNNLGFNTRNCKSQLSLMKPSRKNEFKAYQDVNVIQASSASPYATASKASSVLNQEFLKLKIASASNRSDMNSVCSTKPSARSTSQNFEVFNHMNLRNMSPASSNANILVIKPDQMKYMVPSFRQLSQRNSHKVARQPSVQSQRILPSVNQARKLSSRTKLNTKVNTSYSSQHFPEISNKFL